uniref:Uncharacterized protein n=1 Tax=Physcomitrium patens TaxID=3218 RepID=A0A2K1L7V1_PHYPA|nr:hypothetical protein PHYPA_000498 [Physcomitrium patens]
MTTVDHYASKTWSSTQRHREPATAFPTCGTQHLYNFRLYVTHKSVMVRAAPGSHPELGTKFINAKVLLRKPAKSSPKNPTSKSSALSKLQISTSLPPYNSGCAESRPAVVWNSPIVKVRAKMSACRTGCRYRGWMDPVAACRHRNLNGGEGRRMSREGPYQLPRIDKRGHEDLKRQLSSHMS